MCHWPNKEYALRASLKSRILDRLTGGICPNTRRPRPYFVIWRMYYDFKMLASRLNIKQILCDCYAGFGRGMHST